MYTKNITLCRQISRFQIIRLTKYPRKLIREWKSKLKSFNPLFPPTRQYPIYYLSSFRTYHLRRTSVTTPAFHTLGILTPSRASWKFPASVRRDVRAGGGAARVALCWLGSNWPGTRVSRVAKDSVIPYWAGVRSGFLYMMVLYCLFILSFLWGNFRGRYLSRPVWALLIKFCKTS